MPLKKNSLPKISGCLIVGLALMLAASNLNALEFLTFKYGKIKRDRDVTRSFQTYEVLSEYQYYVSGIGKIPYAIIGVNSKFEMRLGMWKKIDLSKPLLRGWVSQMDNIYGYPPYGSVILDHKNNPIGIWYSSKQWTTVIIEDDNKVAILAPEAPGFRGGK
ncbi:MAG: hypothetical protein HKO68_19390 [Desulfobacterales bacterium]|nr:hypothetical protein [Deltaproteobacteria bacterium]NNL78500.1 hypothetical protein [Desulfobacterales bacterium]